MDLYAPDGEPGWMTRRHRNKITAGESLTIARDLAHKEGRRFPYHRIDDKGIWLNLDIWQKSGKTGAAFVLDTALAGRDSDMDVESDEGGIAGNAAPETVAHADVAGQMVLGAQAEER